jgi:hypothetical protein
MRLLLIAALLAATATPAFAESNAHPMNPHCSKDGLPLPHCPGCDDSSFLRDQWTKTCAMLVEGERRAAGQKDRCARLGGAKIGLDAEGVRKSCWGKPQRINTTTTANHTHEQWVYGGGYLYLDDGVVTSIQTSR